MKKIVLLAVLFCCIAHTTKAQEEQDEVSEEKGFKKEKVFVGGNFGLTFGDYTLINLSPQIGYRFTKLFAAGLGINAQYVSYKERTFNGDVFRKVSQGVTGLNVFGRFYPIQQFFLQVQPEANYLFGNETYYQPKEKYKLDAVIAPSVLMGGGAVLSSNGRSGFVISILYDVLQHEDSPYGKKPVYNFGFNVGL